MNNINFDNGREFILNFNVLKDLEIMVENLGDHCETVVYLEREDGEKYYLAKNNFYGVNEVTLLRKRDSKVIYQEQNGKMTKIGGVDMFEKIYKVIDQKTNMNYIRRS